MVESFNKFASENILPFINEKLGDLDTWLQGNSDKVSTLLKDLGSFAWTGFETFVNLTGKLIDFVVQHPDAVITFFKSLIALKIGSWFVSGAASIGQMIPGLTNFGNAVKKVGPTITNGFTSLNTFASGLGTSISTGVSTAATTVGGKLGTLLSPITNGVSTALAPVVGKVGTALAPVTGAVSTALAPVTGAITTALAPVTGALSTMFAPIASALGTILSPATILIGIVVGLVAAFMDLWNTSEDFRAAFEGMAETIKSKIDVLT